MPKIFAALTLAACVPAMTAVTLALVVVDIATQLRELRRGDKRGAW